MVPDAIRRAEHSLLMLPDCRTVDEVMGMEGAAAAASLRSGVSRPAGLSLLPLVRRRRAPQCETRWLPDH